MNLENLAPNLPSFSFSKTDLGYILIGTSIILILFLIVTFILNIKNRQQKKLTELMETFIAWKKQEALERDSNSPKMLYSYEKSYCKTIEEYTRAYLNLLRAFPKSQDFRQTNEVLLLLGKIIPSNTGRGNREEESKIDFIVEENETTITSINSLQSLQNEILEYLIPSKDLINFVNSPAPKKRSKNWIGNVWQKWRGK